MYSELGSVEIHGIRYPLGICCCMESGVKFEYVAGE